MTVDREAVRSLEAQWEPVAAARPVRPLLVALAVLNTLDIVTTYVAIHLGAHEANPLLGWAIHTPIPFLLKVGVLGLIWYTAGQLSAERVRPKLRFIIIVYTVVVLSNLLVIRHYA